MTKASWVRGDLKAPTTPEQYAAALQRQERVIDRLREERDELVAHVGRLVNAALTEGAGPMMRDAVDSGPTASLAHVQAEAIEGFGVWADNECPEDWFVYTRLALAKHYIEHHIHQSASQAGGE